jgi:hypothetical protein
MPTYSPIEGPSRERGVASLDQYTIEQIANSFYSSPYLPKRRNRIMREYIKYVGKKYGWRSDRCLRLKEIYEER